MSRSRDAILRELANADATLAELKRSRDQIHTSIQALRAELATASIATGPSVPPELASSATAPQTPADKVRLFRTLFRGRADVFPVRFVSKKTNRAGYAPACSNKWQAGLCLLKVGGKCSDCVNQAFIPVGDKLILDHLQGRQVMGVYPLLEDESCWFLAVDFDKGSWRDDVAAFSETCRLTEASVAIERSRSGNGAHAWFFFAAPGVRERREAHGLLPHHRDDEPPARAEHGVL